MSTHIRPRPKEQQHRIGSRLVTAAMLSLWAALGASATRGDDTPTAKPSRFFVAVNFSPSALGADRGLFSVDPETAECTPVGEPELVDGAVSPGGRYLAAGGSARPGSPRLGLWVYDMAGKPEGLRVFDRGWFSCAWANKDKQVIIGVPAGRGRFDSFRVNADGSDLVKLPIPETELLGDASQDGVWLALIDLTARANQGARVVVRRMDGTSSRVVVDRPGDYTRFVRFSPDGKKLVYTLTTGQRTEARSTIWIVDSDGRNAKQVPIEIDQGVVPQPVWSPDASRLAIGLGKKGPIVLIDPDGKNHRKVPLDADWSVTLVDWK